MATKKDYILVASCIKEVVDNAKIAFGGEELGAILWNMTLLIDTLCKKFEEDNEKFDCDMFVGAIYND